MKRHLCYNNNNCVSCTQYNGGTVHSIVYNGTEVWNDATAVTCAVSLDNSYLEIMCYTCCGCPKPTAQGQLLYIQDIIDELGDDWQVAKISFSTNCLTLCYMSSNLGTTFTRSNMLVTTCVSNDFTTGCCACSVITPIEGTYYYRTQGNTTSCFKNTVCNCKSSCGTYVGPVVKNDTWYYKPSIEMYAYILCMEDSCVRAEIIC